MNGLQIALADAKRQVQVLELELDTVKKRRPKIYAVIPADLADPDPNDAKQRATYVTSVANFYNDIGEKKFLAMIGAVRAILDDPYAEPIGGRTRAEFDDLLRGTSNGLKTIMDWMDQMRNEHLANLNKDNTNE